MWRTSIKTFEFWRLEELLVMEPPKGYCTSKLTNEICVISKRPDKKIALGKRQETANYNRAVEKV